MTNWETIAKRYHATFIEEVPSPTGEPIAILCGTDEHAEDPRVDWTPEAVTNEAIECWRNGEVVGFMLVATDGTIIDSCWGFYEPFRGYPLEAAREAAHHAIASCTAAASAMAL